LPSEVKTGSVSANRGSVTATSVSSASRAIMIRESPASAGSL
jgi:hypothetical protein